VFICVVDQPIMEQISADLLLLKSSTVSFICAVLIRNCCCRYHSRRRCQREEECYRLLLLVTARRCYLLSASSELFVDTQFKEFCNLIGQCVGWYLQSSPFGGNEIL
jgi:hypothetical protein